MAKRRKKKTKKNLDREVVNKSPITDGISVSGPLAPMPDSWFANFQDEWPRFQLSDAYMTHAWVYACVRAISTNIAQVPVLIEEGNSDSPIVLDHDSSGKSEELWKLFNQPNPFLTYAQLWESTALYMNTQGMCVWVLERENINEVPKQIVPLGGNQFNPIIEKGILLGWEYMTEDGKGVKLRQDQVLIFKFFNPNDPYRGMSPLEASERGVRLDYLAGDFSEAFFNNSAEPGGVIESEKRMTRQQIDEFREMWESRHRGAGNAAKVAVLYGGAKYKGISMTQKDMEFLEQRRWTRDEILAVFKVPKAEISLYEGVNYATALSQDKSFWQKTLIPIIRNFEAVLRAHFIPGLRPYFNSDLRIFFDLGSVESLQEDLNEKIENAVKLNRIGYPLNVINQRLNMGLPNVEWGDTWFVNSAIRPIEEIEELAELEVEEMKNPPEIEAPFGEEEEEPAPGSETPEEEANKDEKEEEENERNSETRPKPNKSSVRSGSDFPPKVAATASTPPRLVSDPNTRGIATRQPERTEVLLIAKKLKGYLRRLRAEQISLVVSSTSEGKDAKLFLRNNWDTKIVKRFPDNDSEALVKLNKAVGEFLTKILTESSDQGVEESLKKVRAFFNKISSKSNLELLAKAIISRSIEHGQSSNS